MLQACAIRSVAGCDQFIPVEDVVQFEPGEEIYVGFFSKHTQKDGPSGSHERIICLPESTPHALPLSCCHRGMIAPSRDWKSISGSIHNQNNERIFVSHRQYVDMLSAS